MSKTGKEADFLHQRNLITVLRNFDRAGEVINCMKCTDQWCRFPFLFKSRTGESIEINTFGDLVTVWIIFCRHEYKIPEGTKNMIDAGANIGGFSIYASANGVEKIYAIEPFSETFNQLKQNIETTHLIHYAAPTMVLS